MTKFIYSLVLAVVAVCFPIAAHASELISMPFVHIGINDGTYKDIRISGELKLVPDADGRLNVSREEDLSDLLYSDGSDAVPISQISSLGIIYEDVVIAGINENKEDLFPSDAAWTVVSVDGSVVASGLNGQPDLSSLQPGKTYVITVGNKTYKYIHLR